MAVSVRIEDEAFSDRRYDVLARLLNLPDADCARGKMSAIWRQCTQQQRHTLDAEIVRAILGENGVDALMKAELGEQVEDGIRIRGTKGRIEWLAKLRRNGRKGGRPTKTRCKPKPNQMVSKNDVSENQMQTKTEPEPNHPAPVPSPVPVPSLIRHEEAIRGNANAPPPPEPSNLLQAWFHYRTYGAPCGTHEVAAMLEDLKAAGLSEAEILAEITKAGRVKGEFPSEFATGLLRERRPQASGGSKAFIPMSQRVHDLEAREVKS